MDQSDDILMAELTRDEGFEPAAYQDSLGFWTIGIGTLIDARKGGGITLDDAKYLAMRKVERNRARLDQLVPWWRNLDAVRQRVIENMAYNMGPSWVTTFPRTVASIQAGRYDEAANEMLDSRWARQVGDRAKRLAFMMRTGRVS